MPKAASTRSKGKDSKPVKGKKKGDDNGSSAETEKEEKKKRKKRARVKKDPNAPKRGLSAYMFFANEQRDKLRAEQPNLKFGEVGKVLGEKWKALTEAQKAPYDKKAAADKKRYEDEKAAYAAGATADDDDE